MIPINTLSGILSQTGKVIISGSAPLQLLFDTATPEQISIRAVLTRPVAANTTVLGEYKLTSGSTWKSIGNLFFVSAVNVPTEAPFGAVDNFAGCAFDLTPGSVYDVRLTGTEPGVGTWQVVGTQSTRSLPASAPTPNKFATPATITSQLLTLVAGDCLQLADGTYPSLTLARSGTSGAPIYIRGATRTGVIISNASLCVSWSNSSNLVLENLTLQGSGVDSGTAASSVGVVYQANYSQTNTTIRNVIFAGTDRGCKAYTNVIGRLVYNCTFSGNNTWAKTYEINPASGAPNYTWNDDGVSGPGVGNCTWNCTFSGHGDTIKQDSSVITSGATYCGANFTYRCRIIHTGDDACEFDDGAGNSAFYDNVVDNCGQAASFDGIYGGPIYFFRNSIGNTARGPLKPSSFSKHIKIWNNTFVRTTGAVPYNFYASYATPNDNWSMLGNLIIYRGTGEVVRLDAVLGGLEWDYNGIYPSTGASITLGAGRNGGSSLVAAKAALAPLMAHDVAATSNPFSATITLPTDYTTEYVGSMDFTLASGVSVRNAGVAIPGITDGFSGSAPDMGAVIAGRTAALIGDQTPSASAPSWLASLPTDTWTHLAGQSLYTWATSTGSISGAYTGSNPIASIMSAYTAPAYDQTGLVAYMYGGGHSDGSYNGWIKYDIRTGQHSVAIQPTPPSKYPPLYSGPNLPIVYPSGATREGGLAFAVDLTDPADIAYNAQEKAPGAVHGYGQLTYRSSTAGPMLSMFYICAADASLTTGRYTYVSYSAYASQFAAFGINSNTFDHTTYTHFDEVTGLVFVTCTPGDGSGNNGRNHIVVINPDTHTIISVHAIGFSLGNYPAACAVGRKFWVFGSTASANTAVVFDMDSRALEYYSVGGITFTPQLYVSVPCTWGAGNTMYRWNYRDDPNSMHVLNLAPTGGAGTIGSPYTVSQSRRVLSGMSGLNGWQYKLFYSREHNFFVVPKDYLDGWYALKLS